ncbi:hypothetical protein PVAP13_3KG293027 [Panicum virgatum]|uniref:Uncharacterized protein n=1 Tax=Panicum virgatum TaxID=38727 RepID=A0A8T0UUY1_PANVG|nr:hypothetical protein PVAP13_3KG293027 [Panicum virgatum]
MEEDWSTQARCRLPVFYTLTLGAVRSLPGHRPAKRTAWAGGAGEASAANQTPSIRSPRLIPARLSFPTPAPDAGRSQRRPSVRQRRRRRRPTSRRRRPASSGCSAAACYSGWGLGTRRRRGARTWRVRDPVRAPPNPASIFSDEPECLRSKASEFRRHTGGISPARRR